MFGGYCATSGRRRPAGPTVSTENARPTSWMVYTQIYAIIHIYIYMYIYVCVCVQMCLCVHTYFHIYIYI